MEKTIEVIDRIEIVERPINIYVIDNRRRSIKRHSRNLFKQKIYGCLLLFLIIPLFVFGVGEYSVFLFVPGISLLVVRTDYIEYEITKQKGEKR